MSFSEQLKKIRKDSNYTQKDVYTYLHTSPNGYASYEQGRTEPNIDTLKKLADFFGVSVDYLLGRSDDFGTVVIHSDPSEMLTSDEKRLISAYRKLVPNMKKFMLNNAEMLAAQNG